MVGRINSGISIGTIGHGGGEKRKKEARESEQNGGGGRLVLEKLLSPGFQILKYRHILYSVFIVSNSVFIV